MAGGGSCLLLYSLPHSSSLSAAAQQLWRGQAGPAQRPPAQEAPARQHKSKFEFNQVANSLQWGNNLGKCGILAEKMNQQNH